MASRQLENKNKTWDIPSPFPFSFFFYFFIFCPFLLLFFYSFWLTLHQLQRRFTYLGPLRAHGSFISGSRLYAEDLVALLIRSRFLRFAIDTMPLLHVVSLSFFLHFFFFLHFVDVIFYILLIDLMSAILYVHNTRTQICPQKSRF